MCGLRGEGCALWRGGCVLLLMYAACDGRVQEGEGRVHTGRCAFALAVIVYTVQPLFAQ
jgi:hypothetical protein